MHEKKNDLKANILHSDQMERKLGSSVASRVGCGGLIKEITESLGFFKLCNCGSTQSPFTARRHS
jgi:hypothetical protein